MTTNNSNIQEMNSGTPPVTPLQILKTCFGYDSFREGQTEIIDTILSGRDALAIMPTGAGKSLCYQVPALLLPGITLNIINLRKKWKGICSQVPFIVLKDRQGCI